MTTSYTDILGISSYDKEHRRSPTIKSTIMLLAIDLTDLPYHYVQPHHCYE